MKSTEEDGDTYSEIMDKPPSLWLNFTLPLIFQMLT